MLNVKYRTMTTNEVLARHNFITKINFKDGDAQLSRELKVKIMAMRIEYSKVKKSFDADLQEFIKEATPEEYQTLLNSDRGEKENAELQAIIDRVNSDYKEYINTRSQEEVHINNTSLTEEEFNEIVAINAGNDVEINGQVMNSADFLEIFYSLFVEQ
jgi:hypothetical protein